MSWSFKVGRLAGIDVYIHATFLILLAWVGIAWYLPDRSLLDAVNGLLFIAALFGIVVLHELGHALTARKFGIPTKDITLLPIGGVARLQRMPEDPGQEFLVAIAGPAVNVVLAVLFFGLTVAFSGIGAFAETTLASGDILARMMWINVGLAVFNLLPAFPMDGGRILRALLALRLDYVQATQVAVGIGQTMAVLFGLLGLFSNPLLVFIALFVWVGASQELGMVQVRYSLAGIPVYRAMVTDFETLAPWTPIRRAVELVLSGFQQDFPVIENGSIVGILTRDQLMKAVADFGQDVPVSEVMQTNFEEVDPGEMLVDVMPRLQANQAGTLLVVRGEQLLGILNQENLSELIMFRQQLRKSDAPGKLPPRPLPSQNESAGEEHVRDTPFRR